MKPSTMSSAFTFSRASTMAFFLRCEKNSHTWWSPFSERMEMSTITPHTDATAHVGVWSSSRVLPPPPPIIRLDRGWRKRGRQWRKGLINQSFTLVPLHQAARKQWSACIK
jgi:hypothetical protein